MPNENAHVAGDLDRALHARAYRVNDARRHSFEDARGKFEDEVELRS